MRSRFVIATAAIACLGTGVALAQTPADKDAVRPPTLKSKTLFAAAPQPGQARWATANYTRREGVEMVSYQTISTRSDTLDTVERRFSADNGRTWSAWEPLHFMTNTPQGIHRQYVQNGWVDPVTGRLLEMVLDATLPTDNPLEGTKYWTLRYRVSLDGGRTQAVDEPVIQRGDYTPAHPLDGVWIGKNAFMIGTSACRPICTREKKILVPIVISPLGPDGKYYNPGGGYTYHEAAVLIGTWTADNKIAWDLSQRVANDPAQSTRGCDEPVLAEMPDGRILMVIRGSNDVKPQLPGYKWHSVSTDGGRHWSRPQPWTYSDGATFFSPASSSQLLQHSNGRTYWLGNITPHNPRGNRPRYPLCIGVVDPVSLGLVRESVSVVDTRQSDDKDDLQLSNFLAYEDRETHDIVLLMARFFSRGGFRGDAYLYRIAP